MTSIFDEIKSFFSGPSIEKCSKEEKKENDKHDVKVNEENERHKIALNKIKENASCKLKYEGTIEPPAYTKPVIEEKTVMNPLQTPIADVNDVKLEFTKEQEQKQEQEPFKQEIRGGRKRRTKKGRSGSGSKKRTKRHR
jgi:hypothetical protein